MKVGWWFKTLEALNLSLLEVPVKIPVEVPVGTFNNLGRGTVTLIKVPKFVEPFLQKKSSGSVF